MVLITVGCLLSHNLCAEPRFQTLTVGTNVYTNVVVTRVANGAAVCIHTRGTQHVPLQDLPPQARAELRKFFGKIPETFPAMTIGNNTYLNVTVADVDEAFASCTYSQSTHQVFLGELSPQGRSELRKAFAGSYILPESAFTAKKTQPSGAEHVNTKEPLPEVVKEHDRFEKTTRYDLGYVECGRGLYFAAGCIVSATDEEPTIVGRVQFLNLTIPFGDGVLDEKGNVSAAAIWPYAKSHDLIWLVDGKAIDMGTTGYRKNVKRLTNGDPSSYEEYMWAPVSVKVLQKLATAKEVEFRLGSTEKSLPVEKRAGLDVLLASVMKDFTNTVETTDDSKKAQK
jgi:hypothetical protein